MRDKDRASAVKDPSSSKCLSRAPQALWHLDGSVRRFEDSVLVAVLSLCQDTGAALLSKHHHHYSALAICSTCQPLFNITMLLCPWV